MITYLPRCQEVHTEFHLELRINIIQILCLSIHEMSSTSIKALINVYPQIWM